MPKFQSLDEMFKENPDGLCNPVISDEAFNAMMESNRRKAEKEYPKADFDAAVEAAEDAPEDDSDDEEGEE